MHIDIDRDMYTHMYIHTYIHTYPPTAYTHTYIYAHIYIYIYVCITLPLCLSLCLDFYVYLCGDTLTRKVGLFAVYLEPQGFLTCQVSGVAGIHTRGFRPAAAIRCFLFALHGVFTDGPISCVSGLVEMCGVTFWLLLGLGLGIEVLNPGLLDLLWEGLSQATYIERK